MSRTNSAATLITAEHSNFVLDGLGTELKGTYTQGGNTFDGLNLSIAGEASITNGATVTGLTALTVANTGHLLVADTAIQGGSFGVSGVAELENVQFTTAGSFTLSGSGHVVVDGGSQMSFAGFYSQGGTSLLEIKGNSRVNVGSWAGSGGNFAIEEGSTFRFETFGQVLGKTTTTLDLHAKVVWGTGGANIAVSDARRDATLVVAVGTTLVLDGGNYNLDMNADGNDGKLQVQGGTLEGIGNIGDNTGITDGTRARFSNGAKLNPGMSDSVGVLTFNNGMEFLSGASTITFTIDGSESYDQIATTGLSLVGDASMTIKLELSANLLAMSDEEFAQYAADFFVPGSTTFQFLTDLNGNPLNTSGWQGHVNFAFDGVSAARLAANDLGWDTSEFFATGLVGMQTVPEPSTYALIGLGLAALLYHRTRQRGVRVG